MSTLTIRNIDRVLKERLRLRAARNGRSMAAEVRALLRDALDRAPMPEAGGLAMAIRRRMEPFGGVDLPERSQDPLGEPPDFS